MIVNFSLEAETKIEAYRDDAGELEPFIEISSSVLGKRKDGTCKPLFASMRIDGTPEQFRNLADVIYRAFPKSKLQHTSIDADEDGFEEAVRLKQLRDFLTCVSKRGEAQIQKIKKVS